MPRNYVKKGGHGGRRPGAGRKPAGDRVAEDYRKRFAILPLERWLSIINGKDPASNRKPTRQQMDAAARAAAPYVHRRLALKPTEVAQIGC